MAPNTSVKAKTKLRKKSTTKAPAETFISPEMVDDSSEDEEPATTVKVTSTSTEKAAKKRKIDVATEARIPNGKSKDVNSSKSKKTQKPETSSSESESEADPSFTDAVAATNGATASDENESRSGSKEEEDEEEEEEDDSDDFDAMPIDTPQKQSSATIAPTSRPNTTQSGVVEDWIPPEDYTRFSIKSTSSSKLLNPKVLKRKQIWHISIPQGVDIEKIKIIHPDMIEKGAIALKEGGSKYTLRTTRKRDLEGSRILVPNAERNEYEQLQIPVTRTLELRQVLAGAGVSEAGEEDDGEPDIALDPKLLVAQKRYPKAPPPEPRTGLQIMNVPIGVVPPPAMKQFQKPRTVPEVSNGVADVDMLVDSPDSRAIRKAAKQKSKAEKEARKAEKKAKKAAVK